MNPEDELPTLDQKSKKFFETLRDQSVFKNDPIPEWKVLTEFECEGDGSNYCICSTPILYQYCIENRYNKNRLIIGSECIKRWDVEFTCKDCGAALGNITQRLLKKNFVCPPCTRERAERERQKEALKQKMIDLQITRLGRFVLYWEGPYDGRPFSEVVKNLPYTEYLVNLPYKTKSLQKFEEYVGLRYDIVEVPVVTQKLVVTEANS